MLRFGWAQAGAVALIALSSVPVAAQNGTDIWIVPIIGAGDATQLGEPIPVTTRAGYDNQPAFSLDGSLLYFTANLGGQTDIWQIAVDAAGRPVGEPGPFTSTPESEYSAAEVPDRSRIAVIRVEADSTQRLWSFDKDGQNPQLELADVAPVGYHAWSTGTTVGIFVLGSPPSFMIAEAPEGQRRTAAERIGRSLHRVPGHIAVGLGDPMLSFTTVLGDGTHVVSTYHIDGFDTSGIVGLPAGTQDYAWMPDRAIVAGEGSMLLRWTQGGGWTELGELGSGNVGSGGAGLGEITRIAVHPSGRSLAVVVAEP